VAKKVAKKQRQWSRAFTPRGATVKQINISHVPPGLREKFTKKCRREGKSQRNLLLGWIQHWVNGGEPQWVYTDAVEKPIPTLVKIAAEAP